MSEECPDAGVGHPSGEGGEIQTELLARCQLARVGRGGQQPVLSVVDVHGVGYECLSANKDRID